MTPYYAKLRDCVGDELILVPSVAGIVHDDEGRLLLLRKSDGTWSLPAGAIELGESPKGAMARELLEETGLKANCMSLEESYGGADYRYRYPNGDWVEYSVFVFRCADCEVRGEATDDEAVELRWFAREDFPGLELPFPLEVLFDRGR
ncbi:MAG: NUDIX domain-containing protein [Verrucomicrobiota bacterium]